MALTRLSIAVLLVCCFAFAIEKPAVWDSMNLKARQKWERIALGEYRGKATGPSARDKYWASMRKDDSYNNTVPTHKYVEAQNFFISQQSNAKRFYNSPWTNIGPNKNNLVGGRTRAILVQSTGILYAGCVSGGLWKSTNGGTSWKVLTDLMANIAVTAIAEDSTGSIYVGTGEGFNSADAKRGYGIFKASNDVFTQLSSTAYPDFYYVNKIVVGQKDAIYAATGNGLFVSRDSGNSFSTLLKGNMVDVAIAKLNGNDVILCWRAAYGLYVSVDGSNFKQSIGTSNQDDNMHRGSIAVSPSNPSIVYISLSANTGRMVNVYKSADSGQTFAGQLVLGASTSGRLNQVLLSNPYYSYNTGSGNACVDGVSAGGYNQGWYDNAIAVDPLSADIVYIGGVDLWKSNDGGRTFNMISTWWSAKNNYLHADQHTIVFSPKYATDKTVYIGNDGGVYKSTNIDAGRYSNPCSPPTSGLPTYTPLNSNYGTIQFYHGSVHPTSALYVAGCQDNGSWKYSNSQWEIVAGGDGGFTAIDPDVPSRYYTSYTFASITRRESTGDSRVLTNGQLDGDGVFINPFVMDPNNAKVLYTCGKTCYRCSDATAATIAWQPLGSALSQGVSALAVSRDSSKLYIGGQDGAFYRASLPNGAPTQVGQSTLCPNCGKFYISSIAVHPKIADRIFVTISSFGDPHLWQSNDSGNTWTSISSGIPDVPVLDLLIIPTSPSTFYLGTDLGLLYSENDGVEWHWINEFGLANVPVYKLQYQVATETIFAFSHGRGVYKAVTTTTGSTMWSDGSASSTIWQPTIGDGAPMETTTTTGTAQSSKISMPVLIGIAAGGGAVVIVIVVVSVVLVKRKITRKRSESREHVLAKYVEEVIAPVSMQTVVKQ